MKIDAKKLKDTDIEILEKNDIFLDVLGRYNVELDAEKAYSNGCETLFSVYENGERVLESAPFEDVRDYLKERLGK